VAGLAAALGRHARPGRSIHEVVLQVFCGYPQLRQPEPGVRAALTWFSRDRAKGVVSAIQHAVAAAGNSTGSAGLLSTSAYDAAIDAVDELTSKLTTSDHQMFGMRLRDSNIDGVAVANTFAPVAIGLVAGLDAIGADLYLDATRALSAALGKGCILTDTQRADLGRALRSAEQAGQGLRQGAAAGVLAQPIEQVPYATVREVRDNLTVMAEAAAIHAFISVAAEENLNLTKVPSIRDFEALCLASRPVQAYLRVPPPFCLGLPDRGWKQLTHFLIRTCGLPGAAEYLARAAGSVLPLILDMRDVLTLIS
jgi:hypothetical protein